MNKALTILLLALTTTAAFGQQSLKYRAPLPKVDSDRFYRIMLYPPVMAKSEASNLSDIRIYDQQNKPVPYIFGDQLPAKNQKDFITLPQVGKATETDTSTIFIAQNTGSFTINQLNVRLRNTAVERTVNLSGSDDLKSWYAIKENINLTEAVTANGLFEQSLNFPSSTYRYFKIRINHKNQEPVAILQAGVYKHQLPLSQTYSPLKVKSFTQKDSDKISYLTLQLADAYQISQLIFDIEGSKYFKRDIRVYQLSGKIKSLITDTTLYSSAKPMLLISAKTTTLLIEISNRDNPPLNITGIRAYQLDQSLICYLEKNKTYFILLGDSTAITPDYDLKSFTDSLNQTLPAINPGNIYANPAHQIKITAIKQGIPSWVIWAAIVLVVGVLTLLTVKMTKELNKREA